MTRRIQAALHWLRALPWALRWTIVATIAVCALPGVGVLDFYAALLLAPVCVWAAGAIVRAALRGERTGASALRDAAWVLLLPPLLLWLNGLRVPSCAPGTGLVLWLLGPATSMIVGACLAAIAWVLRPQAAHAMFWLLALTTAVGPIYAFVAGPMVASWNELLGMVPGALYEDALGPNLRTLAFRATTTPLWLAIAAWALIARRSGATGLAALLATLRTQRLARVAAVVAATAAVLSVQRGGADGWRVLQPDLERALPVAVELRLTARTQADPTSAPEVMVHVSAAPGWRRKARLLAEDAAVRWLELRTWIGAEPNGTIDVFVYMHDDQKEGLMGARAVEMAKPWLGQAHLVDPGFGETILAHEMAHVFGAGLAEGPFGVPMRHGLLPDAVRIEGFAVAAEWPDDDGLDPHDLTAAMQALHLAPKIDDLLSPLGFATESSSRAYAMAGSLLRFVADRCGAAALQAVYAGADIDDACTPAAARAGGDVPGVDTIGVDTIGVDANHDVRAAWQAMLDTRARTLPEGQLKRLRARFESPGLLLRPCPLETGRCRERADHAWRANNSAAEIAQWSELRSQLLRYAPEGSLPLGLDLAWFGAWTRAHGAASAQELVEARLASATRDVDRAALLSARGDLRLRAGDVVGARADWDAAALAPRSEGARRTLRVKIALAGGAAGQTAIRSLFSLGAPHVHAAAVLADLAANTASAFPAPEALAGRYLNGRRRLLGSKRDAAVAALREVLDASSEPELRREVARLLALDAARMGRCEDIDRLALAAGEGEIVAHWRAAYRSRCAWMLQLGPQRRWLRFADRAAP